MKNGLESRMRIALAEQSCARTTVPLLRASVSSVVQPVGVLA